MINKAKYIILLAILNSCTLAGKNLANLGFFAYLSRLKPKPVECLAYAKSIKYTSSNGTSNSYTCNYKPDSISMECTYATAITEDSTDATVKTEFYNSTEDFILRAKNFAQATIRYSQLNKDITTNKSFQYDAMNRFTGIIQSDTGTVAVTEYDSKNRNTKANVTLTNGICTVPVVNSYDDTNLSLKQTILFSQTTPATNLICYFYSITVPDQVTEAFLDKNLFLLKKVITEGSTVTTETFTTTETAELCTGSDGTPYSAPVIQKFNSTGAAVGETASIKGINFDTDPAANTIVFANGTKTFAASATSSSLSFIVPAGATSGQITIINRFGTGKSKNIFYVYKYFIYAGNSISNSVSGYELNISDGSLANPTTLLIGNQPSNVISNLNGKYAYIINQGILAVNSVTINASTGAMVNSSSTNAGNGARSAAIDFSGNLLFILNQTDNTISRFFMDSNTGSLINLGAAIATGVTSPVSIATHPSLPFLYVTGSGSSNVAAFTIDVSNGNLNSVSGSPFLVSVNPLGITVHPSGLYLYTANTSAPNSISRFIINQLTGALSSEIFYSSVSMESIGIDPSGQFLYGCSNLNSQINSFQISQINGTLTSVGSSVTSNLCRTIVVDPSGKYAYATEDIGGGAGKINNFTIQSNGSLISNGSNALGTNNPKGLTIIKTPQ